MLRVQKCHVVQGGLVSQQTANGGMTEIAAEDSPASPRMSRFLYRCDRNGRRDDSQAVVPLAGPVGTFLGSVQQGAQLGFRCLSIGAFRGDGVTTARLEVEEDISRTNAHGQIVVLEGDPVEGGLRNLFELISRRNIIRAARKAGAEGIPPPLRAWVTAAVVTAAIAITAILSLLTPLGGSNGRGPASLVHPLSLLSAVGIAALGVLAQLLVNFSSRDKNREPPEEKIADWVAGQQNSKAYWGFIDSLTGKFARFNELRCVVVDDFSRLDRPTRDVLMRYVRDYATDRPPELWVVFDPSEDLGTGQFASEILRLRREARLIREHGLPDGVNRVQHFGLTPLDAKQKSELAGLVGHPERAGYRTVKAIVADTDDTLPAYFDEQIPPTAPRQDPARYAAFELLYLLSLATVSGGTIEWGEQALLKKLAAEERQRSRVLREILTSSGPSRSGPSKANLRERLERMRGDFGRVTSTVMRGPEAHLTISAEVGNVLERLPGRFGLADAGLGHLFWALYRNDTRTATANDPFWLRKASEHLLLAASPKDYADRFGADAGPIFDRLFAAVLDAVDDSLRLSQLKLVPRLLQRAADLLEDDDPKKRAALLRHARDAYAVLADDTILRILLELRTAAEPERAGESTMTAATSALELFLQASAGAAHLNAIPSDFAPGQVLAALRGDAELRGGWLALSLQPFVTAQQIDLLVAMSRARVTVPIVTETLSARFDQQGEREVADLVNLSIGLWCWGLVLSTDGMVIEYETAGPRPDIGDVLETAHILALELRKAYVGESSRGGGSILDLAREGLAEELFTVTAATALLLKQRWRLQNGERPAKIDKMLVESMEQLGLQAPEQDGRETLNVLSERMSLLHVTWKALGYEQLATVLRIRRIQLTALLTPTTATLARAQAAEHASIEDRDHADLLGLLSNLTVAQQALPSVEAAAESLVYGVTAALSGEMNEEFSVQLCTLAFGYAHAYDTSLRPIVQYLLAPSDIEPTGTRLDRLLGSMEEERLGDAALQILNVADRVADDGPRLEEALRRRAQSVSDNVRSLLEEQFSIHELIRKQLAGEPVEVDDVLDTWSGHQTSKSFPYVLYRLVTVNDIALPQRLREVITDVLNDFRSYLGQTGIFLLGAKLASRFSLHARGGSADPAEFPKDLIVDVLRTAVNGSSGDLAVETTINVLEFLRKNDAEQSDRYESQLVYWREEKLRLIEERDLPHLISAGRYVLLMLEYVDTLSEYGLRTANEKDVPPLILSGKATSSSEHEQLRRAALQPFLTIGGKPVLNSQFLYGARKLFHSGLSKDGIYDDVRYEFNNAAKDSMQQMFAFLTDLDKIPPSIRRMLERHEKIVRTRLVTHDPSLLA